MTTPTITIHIYHGNITIHQHVNPEPPQRPTDILSLLIKCIELGITLMGLW
jgi:hypothetical protein